jgi:hypothetical protein
MTLSPSGNRLADPGKAPVLIEPIRGRIVLQGFGQREAKLRAHALDAAGARVKEVELSRQGDDLVLELSAAHRTMHYEIIVG